MENGSYGAKSGSGGLWNNGPSGTPGRDPLVRADKAFGEWNDFRILMIGSKVTVYLNNKLVVDDQPLINYWDRKTPIEKRKPLLKEGPIQLQTHGGEIRWRNIYIREIATPCYTSSGKDDYISIFNGRDLSGWKGAIQNYEVVKGAIQCKKGKGGTLFTEKKFKDFMVMLEFKLLKVATTVLPYDTQEKEIQHTMECANFKYWTVSIKDMPDSIQGNTMDQLME